MSGSATSNGVTVEFPVSREPSPSVHGAPISNFLQYEHSFTVPVLLAFAFALDACNWRCGSGFVLTSFPFSLLLGIPVCPMFRLVS